MRTRAGFTLLEVLIGLVIVAVAVAALARAGGNSLDTQAEIEQRTLALWVADNALAELRLEGAVTPGRRRGSSAMGEREWRWDMLIQPAPGDELLRVDVMVRDPAGADQPVLTHTGFLPR